MLTKICPMCGNEFNVWPCEYERRKYCSKTCFNKSKIGKPNVKKRKQVVKTCPVCQKEFSVKHSHAERRTYCSISCMGKAYNKRIEKECLICGKIFEVPNNKWRKDAKFCSVECAAKYKSGKNHWNYKHGMSDTLEYTRMLRQKPEYKAKRRMYNKKPEVKDMARRYKLKRREIEPGHDWKEWITLLKKYNNRCYYCGVKMTKKEGPRQRTRDHLIPLSRGGTDTLENIVPACRSCNSKKGTKTLEEFYSIKVTEGIL